MIEPQTRRQKIEAIDAMLGSWAFREVFLPELNRLREQGEREACDVDLPNARRDAGAGAKAALESLRNYPAANIRFLESEARKENKATLRKSAKKPLRSR